MKKARIISAILTLTLLLGMLPAAFVPASAAPAEADTTERLVYSFDFESDPYAAGWWTRDYDGDGYNWEYYTTSKPGGSVFIRNGRGAMYSESYSDIPLSPVNWLVTPYIYIPDGGTSTLRLWARGTAPDAYEETFRIAYYDKYNDAFPYVLSSTFTTTEDWTEYTVDVSRFAGMYVAFLIVHYDCSDVYKLAIDDFSITNVGGPTNVYRFDFESDPFTHGWTSIDFDEDGFDWTWAQHAGGDTDPLSVSGGGAIWSPSWAEGSDLNTTNRLVSPYFTVPSDGTTTITVWARGSDGNDYAENFYFCLYEYLGDNIPVLISSKRTTTNEWVKYSCEIPASKRGKRVSISIDHSETRGMFRLYLDDFSVDCVRDNGIIISNNFEADPFIDTWHRQDMDGDGYNWTYGNSRFSEYTYPTFNTLAYGGDGAVFSASYHDGKELSPNNWLLSPVFYVPETGTTSVRFMARGSHTVDYAEKFRVVYYYPGGFTYQVGAEFTATNSWNEYTVELPDNVKGELIGVGIAHCNTTNKLRLVVDDFMVKYDSYVPIGDFDKDGEITVADALSALRIAAKLVAETPTLIRIGDTDLDGHVTVADALAILRVAAKLVNWWTIDPYAV